MCARLACQVNFRWYRALYFRISCTACFLFCVLIKGEQLLYTHCFTRVSTTMCVFFTGVDKTAARLAFADCEFEERKRVRYFFMIKSSEGVYIVSF